MSNEKPVLVIGGGISGITAAVELAETDIPVILVEREPYLGGRAAQLYHYFPKLCPPACGLEINFKRIKNNKNITIYTNAEVSSINGTSGNLNAEITTFPDYINNNCTACGECSKICETTITDNFNLDLSIKKAVQRPFPAAYPYKYSLDRKSLSDEEFNKIIQSCKYNAINKDTKENKFNINAAAVILATGWQPYDLKKIKKLGYNRIPNVISNLEMERIAAVDGPTKGIITIPGFDKKIEKIAFIQCAGSRDINHLAYCSRVCCMASVKQAQYILEKNPDAEIVIYYIDIRAQGLLEDFYKNKTSNSNINMQKGKVVSIEKINNNQILIETENTETSQKSSAAFDMAILAAGMVPVIPKSMNNLIDQDEYGFAWSKDACFTAGCINSPQEVSASIRQSVSAAVKALSIQKNKGNENV